ncbi:MAG: biotin/lipoyl-containing protein [Gemmatimonadota bacterium]
MKYVVEVNGRRITVDIDGPTVTVEGVAYQASLSPADGTPVRLVRVGEAVHRVLARRGENRGRWALDLDGTRFEVEALDERMRAIRDLTAAAEVSSGPAPLLAPMPGLVVRVNVAVGDEVSAGQGLVVVEAMKMENELRAVAPGRVLAVRATPGTAVNKGAILVELGALE